MRLTPTQLLLANLEERLPTPRGRIAKEEALRELIRITGQDFGYDAAAWRAWFRAVSTPQSWISRQTSSPEVVRRKHSTNLNVLELLDQIQPGDELRAYRSPPRTWKARTGRSGHVLIRNGTIVAKAAVALS